MSAGSESAIATATAPRRPAQNRTWSQPLGSAFAPARAARESRRSTEQQVDHDRPTDEDADDPPGDRAERLEEAARRDREADEQEDDGRQQVGEELPDGVDGVRARRGHRPAGTDIAEDDGGRDRRDHPGQVERVRQHVAAVGQHDRDRQLDEVVVDEPDDPGWRGTP